jgi:hypothetical protein
VCAPYLSHCKPDRLVHEKEEGCSHGGATEVFVGKAYSSSLANVCACVLERYRSEIGSVEVEGR